MNLPEKIKNKTREILKGLLNPNSLSNLQLLSSIYKTISTKKFRNKRSLFYDSVTIYNKQSKVDGLIKKYLREFECKMEDLYIRVSPKGLMEGEIEITIKTGEKRKMKGKNIIPNMEEIREIETYGKEVLVIEKDSIFSHVGRKRIIICGKGYPDLNTIRFLQLVKTKMFCLTDLDPHGLQIFLTYRRYVQIERIGLKEEDLPGDFYDHGIKMKERELRMLLNNWKEEGNGVKRKGSERKGSERKGSGNGLNGEGESDLKENDGTRKENDGTRKENDGTRKENDGNKSDLDRNKQSDHEQSNHEQNDGREEIKKEIEFLLRYGLKFELEIMIEELDRF